MGKYMRKSKMTGDVAVVDLTLGVRTRAKTLALQRRSPPYLLRSRRRPKDAPRTNPRANHRIERPPPRPRCPVQMEEESKREEGDGPVQEEGSFGENALEIDSRERSTRESTPSNLVRNPESIQTPGSTTRPASSTDAERRSQSLRGIPSTGVLDGFFAKSEEEQRQAFIQKYNFDPLEEKPLPGSFEWEKVEP